MATKRTSKTSELEEMLERSLNDATKKAESSKSALGASSSSSSATIPSFTPYPGVPTSYTKTIPAGSVSEETPAEIMSIIRTFSPAFRDMAKEACAYDVETKVQEPEYSPPPVEIPQGMRSLGDLVAGCDPIPIKVFDAMDWPEQVRSYIPQALPNGGKWHWPVKLLNDLAFALHCQDRVLLHGPTGSGKSTLAEAWCFLTQTPFIRVPCHREMQSTDFLGKDIIKATPHGPVLEYDWSLTTLAAKHGGMLVIDEAFRSPHLMAIQSLLERNGTLTLPDAASLTPDQRRIVPPSDKSWIVLTDNSVGTGDDTGAYVTEVQDVSTLDRITAAIHVDYTDPAQEAKELGEDFDGMSAIVLNNLTLWAGKVRDAFKSGNMQQTISRRALGAILRKYAINGNLQAAVNLSFVNKLGGSDQHKARESWMQVFGTELAQTA